MEKITTVGIDLAKNVFSPHGVDANGKAELKRAVRRADLVRMVANLPPCIIGMETCSGSHAWARKFESFGHTVRLMAPAFVVPYRKSGKNDGNDAEAICEAAARPSVRFVPNTPLGIVAVAYADEAIAIFCEQFLRAILARGETQTRFRDSSGKQNA